MAQDYKSTILKTRAIVIKQDFFSNLDKIFSGKLKLKEYSTYYNCLHKNGKFSVFTDFNELLKCDNSFDREIKALFINFVSDDIELQMIIGKDELITGTEQISDDLFYIDVLSQLGICSISAIITGEKELACILYDELKYQINRISKPKLYSIFARCGTIFTLIMALLLYKLYFEFFGIPDTIANPILGTFTPVNESNIWKIYLEGIGTCIACSIMLRIPIKKIFPRVVFLFGDGESEQIKKEKMKENIVWNIFIVLLVSVIGGIAIELLTSIILF